MKNKTPNRYDPSPSFRYHVEIGRLGISRFTECSGLEFEQQTFDYAEGGVNTHYRRFPTRFKYGNLTLKKGMALDGHKLWQWVEQTVQGKIKLYDVTVILFDSSGKKALRTWVFEEAYPVKWSATAFTSEQSAVAIETLALAHQGLRFPVELAGEAASGASLNANLGLQGLVPTGIEAGIKVNH